MSVREDVGEATLSARKPGGILIFLPLLIVLLGAAAIYLGQLSEASPVGISGYGIDEITTGAITPLGITEPIIILNP